MEIAAVFLLAGFVGESAGRTALWNWETCLPVPKRRHVAALHREGRSSEREIGRDGEFTM